MRTRRGETRTAVIDRPHARRIGEAPCRLAADEGIIRPAAFPKLVGRIEELSAIS